MMKIVKINSQNPEKQTINEAVKVLEDDGIIVYPTDTIYGLGVNIFSETAIKKVYSLKKRDYRKPLSVCVSRIEDIKKIAYLDEGEKDIEKILPGPYTIILRKKENIPSTLTAGTDRIGVRIPDNQICRELTLKFPITATSANLSGEASPGSVHEVIKQLGDSVDLILDGGETQKIPSTVIDWTTHPPEILRKGVKDFRI